MSSKRELRPRQLVPDSNNPGKRSRRAITISCERPILEAPLNLATTSAKKQSAKHTNQNNKTAKPKDVSTKTTNDVKQLFDLILMEKNRLSQENGRITQMVLDKDARIMDLLDGCSKQKERIANLINDNAAKDNKIQQLENTVKEMKEKQKTEEGAKEKVISQNLIQFD